ncbi:hypothetical protein L195_g060909 [Trifolium pratense]|uniref:Uncharacterized protein n=1 Tax=Trifolium pratense TaxID=57577 RepID=A0A2K3K6P0_TRIPR|nr:hypothetical protein L195_g060909 [Trifolium pratense]
MFDNSALIEELREKSGMNNRCSPLSLAKMNTFAYPFKEIITQINLSFCQKEVDKMTMRPGDCISTTCSGRDR